MIKKVIYVKTKDGLKYKLPHPVEIDMDLYGGFNDRLVFDLFAKALFEKMPEENTPKT